VHPVGWDIFCRKNRRRQDCDGARTRRSMMRERIRREITRVVPFDDIERMHRADALAWIDSGAELCRRARPATPPKHLVSYVAVVDGKSILLVDHRNARLWLPTGGHVEPGEHPRATVARELEEELGFPCPHDVEAPAMITCTETVGTTAGHVDVSLWYVVRAARTQRLSYAADEFVDVRWFAFDELPLSRTDPHLARFVAKLTAGRAP
jgi:8-oxo-dGTP diphosphatase